MAFSIYLFLFTVLFVLLGPKNTVTMANLAQKTAFLGDIDSESLAKILKMPFFGQFYSGPVPGR